MYNKSNEGKFQVTTTVTTDITVLLYYVTISLYMKYIPIIETEASVTT
jgi:hypothetical protein